MTLSSINFQKLAAVLICSIIAGYLLVAGRSIFIPIAFAIFFSFVLYPICALWEQKGVDRPWAIAWTFLILFTINGMVVMLFSSQLIAVVSDLTGLEFKLQEVVNKSLIWVESNFNIEISKDWIENNLANIVQAPITLLATSIKSSTTLLANLILTIIYTVLLLLYRSALKNFWLSQIAENRRETAVGIIKQIQTVVQKYLYGLGVVIVLLGVLNSLGLWIIGIDYPFFWGFFSALLAIIPYVGTFIGAFLPFMYSLITSNTWWQPTAVAVLFLVVQQLEGNFITPKLVGSNIKINPLAAIFSLIVGGTLWGVAGLILALPLVAILKISLDNTESLKPLGALLSSDIYNKEKVFQRKYNQSIYRVFQIFSKREK